MCVFETWNESVVLSLSQKEDFKKIRKYLFLRFSNRRDVSFFLFSQSQKNTKNEENEEMCMYWDKSVLVGYFCENLYSLSLSLSQ